MSTIEPIVPGGVVDFGGGPISVVGGGILSSSGDGLWGVLAQVLLDSGSEYLAVRDVSLLGRTYDGRVQRWGRVEKSVPALSGLPQTGDAVFRIVDTDCRWRDLMQTQTLRGRTIRLKFVKADSTADDFEPFFTGEIVKLSSGPGYIEVTARDMSWAWMDEALAPLLTSDNLPYILPEADGAFAMIVIGPVSDEGPGGTVVSADQQGAVQLTHLGQVGAYDRWGAFRHTLFDIALYRRTSAGGAAFFPVDPGEYNVTVENLTVDGYTYEMTYIDFLALQEPGASIRANPKGLYFRPAFGSFPAEGYDPILNPAGVAGVLENPIDGLLNLFRLEFRKAQLFDFDGIMAIREKFQNVRFTSGGFGRYRAAGAIVDPETPRSILGKYLPCFNLDMFHNRRGEVAFNFSDATDAAATPLYSDNQADGPRQMIERESFYEDDPDPAANRCVLPAYRHYAGNSWLWTGIYDNFADQSALSLPRRNSDDSFVYSGGVLVRDSRIEPLVSEVWFCRDFPTIYDVAVRRMSFAALGSYRQYFDLPTPEIIEEIEMTMRVLVTHRAGRAAGGYRRQELKIIGEAFDLATFRTTLSTVRSIPGTILISGVPVHGAVTISSDSEVSAADTTTSSTYELIASSSASSEDSLTVNTPPIDTTGADLLVAAVADKQLMGGTLLTDNYGNVWVKDPPTIYQDLDSSNEQVQIWYCRPTAVGPLHVLSGNSGIPTLPSQPGIAFAAFRNSAASPFDVESGSAFYGLPTSTIQPGAVTPSADGALIVTALATDTNAPSLGIDSGFTILEARPQIPTAFGVGLAYLIQGAAGAVNPEWDTGIMSGIGMSAAIASFKVA